MNQDTSASRCKNCGKIPEECKCSELFLARIRDYEKEKEKERLERKASIITNEAGGKQHALDFRADLIPWESLKRASAILAIGEVRYGKDNWKLIERRSHVEHALAHLVQFLIGDTSEDHLGNALCLMLFANGTLQVKEEDYVSARKEVDEALKGELLGKRAEAKPKSNLAPTPPVSPSTF